MIETKESGFQYTTPRILKFDYTGNPNLKENNFKIGISHQKSIEKISENEAKVTLCVRIQSTEEPSPFNIDAVVEAKFRWTESVKDILPNLLNQNAPSLLVGYLRPIISMFTNSSGMSPYNLPMLDFTDEPIE